MTKVFTSKMLIFYNVGSYLDCIRTLSFLLLFGLLFSGSISAQGNKITFSEHIAPIIYAKCGFCHRTGEIAPMPLTNYQEVSAYARTIQEVTESRYMPPWKPDPTYSKFNDERYLTSEQIELIKGWVTAGTPEGDPNLTPKFPEFPSGSQLGTPDVVLKMSEAFPHKGINKDRYQIFVLPTNFTEDKEIAAVEFRPGNNKIVHHAIIAIDTKGQGRALDEKSPDEYGYEQYGGFGFNDPELIGGWTPGNTPQFYPKGIAKIIPKGSDILLQMHYAPYPVDASDSSTINIFYTKKSGSRKVMTQPIISPYALDVPFVIPANEVKTFHAKFKVPVDASLISVYPHMHLLGKSWEIFAVTPANDTIKIIKIKDWDFKWQSPYRFPKLKKIPAGSSLEAIAVYDNTVNNPVNPRQIPRDVTWGESTYDEMILAYFDFLPYQKGDEDIPTSIFEEPNPFLEYKSSQMFPIFPNPNLGTKLTVSFALSENQVVDASVLDISGRELKKILTKQKFYAGKNNFEADLTDFPAGTYLIQMQGKNWKDSRQIIIQR